MSIGTTCITHIFCGGRVHLEHVHDSVMILQLHEEWSM
jgi:hypothetical protein